ncbi:MAG: cupin domain-containing protein [Phaeobacter italicus]
MKYAFLCEDEDGVSRFEDREAELPLRDFVPPAAPLNISDVIAASGFVFLTLPAGWTGVPHRSPHRQIAAILSGCFRVRAGSGEVRDFRAGDLFWMEDTTGAGHASSAEGGEPVHMIIVQLT